MRAPVTSPGLISRSWHAICGIGEHLAHPFGLVDPEEPRGHGLGVPQRIAFLEEPPGVLRVHQQTSPRPCIGGTPLRANSTHWPCHGSRANRRTWSAPNPVASIRPWSTHGAGFGFSSTK